MRTERGKQARALQSPCAHMWLQIQTSTEWDQSSAALIDSDSTFTYLSCLLVFSCGQDENAPLHEGQWRRGNKKEEKNCLQVRTALMAFVQSPKKGGKTSKVSETLPPPPPYRSINLKQNKRVREVSPVLIVSVFTRGPTDQTPVFFFFLL